MKYHNKQKRYRLTWQTSPGPNIYHAEEAKKWCQQQPSLGKFYFHYTNTRWWFENKEDALHFALVWGNR